MNSFLSIILVFSSFSLFGEQVSERFPEPTEEEIRQSEAEIEKMGKEEILWNRNLSWKRFGHFLYDRYKRGREKRFHYRGANPEELSVSDFQKPAIILLHSASSNQGMWIPLLETIRDNGTLGPVFTFNYEEKTDQKELIATIQKVKKLYGEKEVELCLVGHSRGAIVAAEYGFDQSLWVEGTVVKRVISIAGRLRNLEPPIETPYYPSCYDVLERIDHIWVNIAQRDDQSPRLCMIAAGDDWLVPEESVFVIDDEESCLRVPGRGHVRIAFSKVARKKVVEWLLEDIDYTDE